MLHKSKKHPNVIFATITSESYNPYQDVYRIDASDRDTGRPITGIRARFENVSPHAGDDIIIWKNIDNIPKYVACNDVIAMEFGAFDAHGLDRITMQHFNEYKRKSRNRLKIRANIDEAEQNIAMINMINTKHNVIATNAKMALVHFLNNRVQQMRETLNTK